jgi:hypothetical protein
VVALVALVLTGAWSLRRPSHERTWVIDQQRLPRVEFAGNTVVIHDVRNFRYDSTGAPIIAYEDRTYNLDRIESVWFALSPFNDDWRGPAHAFLSFGFADSQFVAISVEARRELGEEYSLLKGVLRNYELLYVIGDERDLIGLRANHRGDDVFLYPIRASNEKVRELFVQMLERANRIYEQPEFYNTVTNNCTTNLVDHANSLGAVQIPYGREVLMPGYSDELVVKLGLLGDSLSVEQARERYRINQRAREFADDPLFSLRIRGVLP